TAGVAEADGKRMKPLVIDGTLERHHFAIGAAVALHADAADREMHGAVRYRVRGKLDRRHRARLVRAEAANGEAGAGKGPALGQALVQAQRAAQFAHLVLVEFGERLDHLALGDELAHLLAAIVMRLDECRRAAGAARFDGVGIDRALAQKPRLAVDAELRHGALLHLDEEAADDAALLLGLDDALERAHESLRLVAGAEAIAEADGVEQAA